MSAVGTGEADKQKLNPLTFLSTFLHSPLAQLLSSYTRRGLFSPEKQMSKNAFSHSSKWRRHVSYIILRAGKCQSKSKSRERTILQGRVGKVQIYTAKK